MDEPAAVIGGKKLVEVKGEINILAVNIRPLVDLIGDHPAHLIREQVQAGQPFVGIVLLGILRPAFLRVLLISVGPVIYLRLRKFAAGKGFERRAG